MDWSLHPAHEFQVQTPERILWLVPFIVLFSLGWGFSVTTRIPLQRSYFGRASFGAILGFISRIMMIGNISGAPLAEWTFDSTSSYQVAWYSFTALIIIGSLLAVTIPSLKVAQQTNS